MRGEVLLPEEVSVPFPPRDPDAPVRSVRVLLFADVKGFSRLSEKDCLRFRRRFHAGVASEVLAPRGEFVLAQRTWGDALHVVLSDLAEAGRLALDLQDWMAAEDWAADGLESVPRLRVALHAGVVTRVPDPISPGYDYVGRNTSRAARIEPIAFEGQVFVSGAYAALLAPENPPDLHLEYVGVRELPKGAGSMPVFLLVRVCGASVRADAGKTDFREERSPA